MLETDPWEKQVDACPLFIYNCCSFLGSAVANSKGCFNPECRMHKLRDQGYAWSELIRQDVFESINNLFLQFFQIIDHHPKSVFAFMYVLKIFSNPTVFNYSLA